MKQKDIALILVVAFISAIASFLITRAVFGTPATRQTEVEEVQAISSQFSEPDKRYFNDESFDPTRQITIGPGANPDPFSGDGSSQ